MPKQTIHAFISSTSNDLLSYREAVCKRLLESGIQPIAQEYLPPDYKTLKESLHRRIQECDVVICLVGFYYGAEPDAIDEQRRSYTQIEYDVGRKLQKQVYVYLSHESLRTENPSDEPEDKVRLQSEYRNELMANQKCEYFKSKDDLTSKISLLATLLHRDYQKKNFQYLHPPAPPAYFIGRDEELSQLDTVFSSNLNSIILVLGMGGQGKTSLVNEWINQKKEPLPQGQWCTAYRGGFTFENFLDEALNYFLEDKFDKREYGDIESRSRKLILLLQENKALFVIDGIERWLNGWLKRNQKIQTIGTDTDRNGFYNGLDNFLHGLSGLTSGTKFIITSRAIPSALDNAKYSIVPVYKELDEDITLKGLKPKDAVKLLRHLGVKGTDEQINHAAEIYGFHPLALNVLAGLLKRKHGGNIDKLPPRDPLGSKQSLFKLFEEIRQNLPGDKNTEKVIKVAALSNDNISLKALAAAMSLSVQRNDYLKDQILLHADWNLLKWDADNGIIILHPLVKQFFSELIDSRKARVIHRRYSDWYAAQPLSSDATSLEDMKTHILSIEHALNGNDISRCKKLIYSTIISNYSFIQWLEMWAHFSFGVTLLEKIAAQASSNTKAEILIIIGAFCRQIGEFEKGEKALNESIAIFGSYKNIFRKKYRLNLIGALINRGNIRWHTGFLKSGLMDFNRAFDLLKWHSSKKIEMMGFKAQILMSRGVMLREMGQFSPAEIDSSQAAKIYREIILNKADEYKTDLAVALINLGCVLAELHKHSDSISLFNEAIEIYENQNNFLLGEASQQKIHAKIMMAASLTAIEDFDEAKKELNQSIIELQNYINEGKLHLEHLLALAWLNMGLVNLKQKNWEKALSDCSMSINIYERLINSGRKDVEGVLAHALLNRSEVYFYLGDIDNSLQDRNKGFSILKFWIEEKEYEAGVLYLRKSIDCALYLAEAHYVDEATELLEEACKETKTGIIEGYAKEALKIEIHHGLEKLSVNNFFNNNIILKFKPLI